MSTSPDTAQLRRWMYHLIIAIAFGMACGRIVSVQRVYEPAFHFDPNKKGAAEVDQEGKKGDPRPLWPTTRPDSNAMFGSNDRARWATIRSLVHERSYIVGRRDTTFAWVALLMANDPLEAVVLVQAGSAFRTDVSNPLSHSGIIFKSGLKEHGFATIDRVMDPATGHFYSSKPPLLSTLLAGLYWVLYHVFGLSLIEQPTIVVRVMLILVNALPYVGYLWLLTQLADRWGRTDWGRLYIVAAGAFGTTVTPFLITLNNHTFATFSVMAAWWSVLCVWDAIHSGQPPRWQHFLSAGFFASFAVTNEMPALSFATACFVLLLWWRPMPTLLLFLPIALVMAAAYFGTNYVAIGQPQPVQSAFESPWYRYEGSHWNPPPAGQKKFGIDWAKYHETRAQYALHLLVGHHGLFTHTPIWLLALAGMIAGSMRHWQTSSRERDDFPWFVQSLGLALTVVVVGFYFVKSDNYGGFTNGLRWLMWLTPIWLTCLLPIADRLAENRAGRRFAGMLLAISVLSASYQLWSPWRHPWMFDLMLQLGWPGY